MTTITKYTTDNQDEFIVSKSPDVRLNLRLKLEILNSETTLFLSEKEVDEFCELLQQKKKEIWNK